MADIKISSELGRQWRWLLSALTALLILLSHFSPVAIANMADPFQVGDLFTEPWASVANFDIRHEDLRLDLRQLETSRFVQVEATYFVHNPGVAVTVPLLFAAPGLADGSVTIDDQPAMAVTPTAAPAIPEEWGMPQFRQSLQGFQFDVPLTSGEHTITVAYRGVPDSDDAGVYRQYTLEYWLSPARQWRSFGTLTVDVFAPKSWSTTLVPPITAVAQQHWQTTFDQLPSEQITVTTRPVLSPMVSSTRLLLRLGSIAISLYIVMLLYRKLGRLSRQHNWSSPWLVLTFVIGVPLSIPLVISIAGTGLGLGESLLNTEHLGVGYRYSRAIFALLASLAIAMAALLIAVLSFTTGRIQNRLTDDLSSST
ncbi:MAG: hypothetical protein ACFBSG_16645 [Leptolyngbyaceae cyanobacterium]